MPRGAAKKKRKEKKSLRPGLSDWIGPREMEDKAVIFPGAKKDD